MRVADGYVVATRELRSEDDVLTVDVRARVEPEPKQQASEVLEAAGLDVSTAIRLFLRAVVEKGGLPMDLPRPNAKTRRAIRAARAGRVTDVAPKDL